MNPTEKHEVDTDDIGKMDATQGKSIRSNFKGVFLILLTIYI